MNNFLLKDIPFFLVSELQVMFSFVSPNFKAKAIYSLPLVVNLTVPPSSAFPAASLTPPTVMT